MSDQLTAPTHEVKTSLVSRLSPTRRAVLDFIVVVVAFAAAGSFCGLVWESLWPSPEGIVFEHQWYLQPDSLPLDFSATGLYVVVAVAAGLVLAAVIGLVVERDELVTTVAVLVGSALAAWLMYAVGHRLGPADPRPLALKAADYDPLPSDLRIEAHGATMAIGSLHVTLPTAPFLAFPLGAVVGLALIYFVFGHRGSNAPPSAAV
jgi:hypothetical protein